LEDYLQYEHVHDLRYCSTTFMNSILCLITSIIVVSCLGVVAKTYLIPNDWSVGNDLLCHTLGAVSIHTTYALYSS
jgi:hypothetical protein